MKVLILNAHPEPENNLTYSAQLLKKCCDEMKKEEVEILDLYQSDIPRLDGDMLELFRNTDGELTAGQKRLQKRMQELMRQFKSAKRIVVVLPVHNFNIPSMLKDYMDNILISRETFRYVTGGSEGLMTDGRKILVLQSSGSIYTRNDRYTPLEFSHYYLKEMFCNIMGFGDFHIIRMQGTAVGSVDNGQALQDAFEAIKAFVPEFLKE